MKYIYKSLLLLFSLSISYAVFATNGTMSGNGTDATPYLVQDYADLKVVGTTATYTKAKTYRLAADIDASASRTENAGAGFLPIGVNTPVASNFTGKFKGSGHTIRNLYINRATTSYVGLFGYVTGTVDSLNLEACYIKGSQYVGGVVGYATAASTLNSCKGISDTIMAATNYVGGIIGYCIGGTRSNFSNSGIVSGPTNVGGIIGYALTSPIISICENKAIVTATGSNAGGIVGNISTGSITQAYNYSKINALNFAGGISGISSTCNISYCFNTATISTSNQKAGGISGSSSSGSILNSYNTGAIQAYSYAGGIAGYLSGLTVDNTYTTGQITATATVGGAVGQAFNGVYLQHCYSSGYVSGGNYSGAFVGFGYDSYYPNSFYDISNSGKIVGIGYSSTIDTTLSVLLINQLLDSAYTDSLNYQTVWQIRNDSTMPALRGLDNAPFAINDTLFLSGKDYKKGKMACNLLMKNDYDYETLQANLLLKIQSLDKGTTDSIEYINLPSNIKNNDTIRVSYRVGESRIAKADTLWGNISRSFIVMNNHLPKLLVDTFSIDEDTPTKIPVTKFDFDEDTVSFSIVDSPLNGSAQVMGDSIKYSPNANYNGMDSLRIELFDGFMKDSLWIKIRVKSINDKPIARDTIISSVSNTLIKIKAPVSDEDDSILSVFLYNSAQKGIVSTTADSISYSSNVGANGNDTIYWYAKDSHGLSSDTVKLVISISAQALTLSKDTINLEAFALYTDSLQVSSNTSWIVSGTPSWLHISPNSSSINAQLHVTSEDNPSLASREATISVSTTEFTKQFVVIQKGKIQLSTTSYVATTKTYDGGTNASITLGKLNNLPSADSANVSLNGIANYNDPNTGSNKTITIAYTLSGIAAGKYMAPTDSVINNATIYPKQLSVTAANVSKTKTYDATTTVTLTAGNLTGVESADLANITLSATGAYDNANVGNNKTITIAYTIGGNAANNYLTPYGETYIDGVITPYQLRISAATIKTDKMYDGSTSAEITAIGTLKGVNPIDIANLTASATANFNNPDVGINKTITVQYSISGSAAANYLAPADSVYGSGRIRAEITLAPLSAINVACKGSSFSLPYQVLTGEAAEYSISYDDAAHQAGFVDTNYKALSSAAANGTLTINIPNSNNYGIFTANVCMRNSIKAESKAYSFTFTINVPASLLVKKFDDVILVNNTNNDFTTYQWYKNGGEIADATNQFYCESGGLFGKYYAKVKTTNGIELLTCEKEVYTTLKSASAIKVYPSPIKQNQTCSVNIDLPSEELIGAELLVYNNQGEMVYKTDKLTQENHITFANKTGMYVLQVRLQSGNRFSQKIIVE